MSAVRVEHSDGIGRVTLDRPERMNAITRALGSELEAALRDLGSSSDVVAVSIRGAGGNFCAGGDFDEVALLRPGGAVALRPLFANFAAACRAVEEIPQPVVAVVEGVATAGGFELMQACDLVLVHDEARLCDNHINFGQVPGGGSTQRLPRLVGRQRALGHLLSGERLRGADAVAWGIALHSYAAADFDASVADFMARLASRHPDALRTIKRLVRDGLETDLADGLARELDAVLTHIAGEAGGDGVTAFDEHREGARS